MILAFELELRTKREKALLPRWQMVVLTDLVSKNIKKKAKKNDNYKWPILLLMADWLAGWLTLSFSAKGFPQSISISMVRNSSSNIHLPDGVVLVNAFIIVIIIIASKFNEMLSHSDDRCPPTLDIQHYH